MKKFFKILGYVVILVVAIVIFRYMLNCGNKNDKKIIEQAADIIKKETTIKAKEEAIQALKEKIKQRDGKLLQMEGVQKVAKLSMMETEKELNKKIAGIEKLRVVGKDHLTISIDQWEVALVEIEKYKEKCINNDMKWASVVKELKLKIIEQDGLLKLWEDYKRLNDTLKVTLKSQIQSLAKKANRRLYIGTLNVDLLNYSASGFEYTSVGIGISYHIFKPKLSIAGILKNIYKLN